ncbi:hypothetical protein Tco_0697923 [Tanacetum coccineum]
MYVSGCVDIFDMVDIDLFTAIALNMMVLKLGYTGEFELMFYNYLRPLTSLGEGLYALACEEDVRCLATLVRSFKLIEVYIEHGVTILDSYLRAPRFRTTLEDITDELGSIAANRTEKMLLLTWHESSETTKEPVCDSITPSSCKDFLSGVQGVDTQSHVLPTIQSQFSDINLSFVSQQATTSQVIDDVLRQLSFDEIELDGEAGFANVATSGVDSSGLSHDESFGVDDLDLNLNEPEPILAEVSTQEPIVAEVSTQEPIVAEVSTQKPIVAEVSTEVPIVEEVGTQEFSMEDVILEDYFFYDDEGIDTAYEFEYDVQSNKDASTYDDDDVDEYFLVDEENEILEPDVDVLLFHTSMDMILIVTLVMPMKLVIIGGEEIYYCKRKAKDRVYLHSIKSKRKLKLYKNDSVRVRARCDRKVLGTRPTGLNQRMDTRPSGSSGPIRVNSMILVKVFQDQLQRHLELHVSMSNAFRAKAKAKREIRGDCILQYFMLRDYVVELQSTTPNTIVKITVERNNDSSLPTRVFHRIHVCLEALKLGFKACRRELLGLDGDSKNGPFPGQVLVDVRLDSKNIIYPLAYALVEAESNISWCWFLQCLGDDIDMHPNSNFTFISDRQKRHIQENMKHGWCRQAYKDLLWRSASSISVKEFEKCMLEIKKINPKAHEWLNKIPPEHWARSYFTGRAKSDLLLKNICEVFNGKKVGGRDKPMIILLEYIMEYCIKRILNVQSVIDKCTGLLTPTATRIMESIKKETHLMKVQWNGGNKYQVSGSFGDQSCWNMALNNRVTPPLKAWENPCYWLIHGGKHTLTRNIGHNKATCKGQGQKATIGGACCASGAGVGVGSQISSHTR